MMELRQERVWTFDKQHSSGYMFDTTFVLFFLAVDCGRRFEFGIDGLLSLLTLAAFIAVPYLLPFDGDKPAFEGWVIGRIFITLFAFVLGMLFDLTVGVIFPEVFGYAPMTLLIVSALVSFFAQFSNIIRFRLAR